MTQAHQQQLFRDFPNLYKHVPGTERRPWLECGDGWFQPIYRLSLLLEELILQEPEEQRESFWVFQTKEKFGSLRYYMGGYETQEMSDLIHACECATAHVCEACGEPGKERDGGWIKTLCDTCHSSGRKTYSE